MKQGPTRPLSERTVRSASQKLRVTFCDNLVSSKEDNSEKSTPVRVIRVPSAVLRKSDPFGFDIERLGTPKPILKYSKDRLHSEESPQSACKWTDGLKQRLKQGLKETSHFESLLQPRLDSARSSNLCALSDRRQTTGRGHTGQMVIKRRPIHSSESRGKLFKSSLAEASDYKISTSRQLQRKPDQVACFTTLKKSFSISGKDSTSDLKVADLIEKKCTLS